MRAVDEIEAVADELGGLQYERAMSVLAQVARAGSAMPIEEMLARLARVTPELDADTAAAVVDQFQLLEAFREVKRAVETIRERVAS